MIESQAIITGFEPFGPYLFNPTADLAFQLDGQLVGDTRVRGIVLPATYDTAYQMLQSEVTQICPRIVISFGLSSSIPRIRVEACGRNEKSGKYADKLGITAHGEKIDPDGTDFLHTNTNVCELVMKLTLAGIPADISFNADTFICNALIYRMMMAITAGGIETTYAFIHVPWTDNYLDRINLEKGKITVPWSTLETIVQTILVK